MDIKAELRESQNKRAELIKQMQALDQQKALLLSEALKLEGEIRVLQRLDGKKVETEMESKS